MLIYMATNKVNGKRYVGATSRGLAVRKYQHFNDGLFDTIEEASKAYQDKALEFYGEFARAA